MSEPKKCFEKYMFGTKCMSLVNEDCVNDIIQSVNMGINVFVSNDRMIECVIEAVTQSNNVYSDLITCNYMEFVELISSNKYYISGVVGIYLPEDISLLNRLINIIENCVKNENIYFILFSENDLFISNKNKRLSELAVIQHYRQV